MNSSFVKVAVIGLTLVPCALARAQGQTRADSARAERFAVEVDRLRNDLVIPGLSVAILRDQKVIWSRGFGFADVAHQIRATPETPYEVASLSKTFASVLLMQLVEQGKLDLDAPMSKFSDQFKDDAVKVRHVFSHTSEGVPGMAYKYNGNIFEALSEVVKSVSGKKYREVLSMNILEPIGAEHSSPGNDLAVDQQPMRELLGAAPFGRYTAAVQSLAKPYRLYGEEAVETIEGLFGIGAANGVVSSVVDLAKFDAAIDRHQFITAQTQELAWTPARSPSGEVFPYGLGWMVQRIDGERIVWHNGYLPDRYSALIVKLPERGLTLIVLGNSDALSSPFRLAEGDIRTSPFGCAFIQTFIGDARPAVASGCNARSQAMLADWRKQHRESAHREVVVDAATVAGFAGDYEVRPGTVLTIAAKGLHLVRIQQGGDLELFPESRARFFAKRTDVLYSFGADSVGQPNVTIQRGDQSLVARRVGAPAPARPTEAANGKVFQGREAAPG